mgnify:CR=1 FL=1
MWNSSDLFLHDLEDENFEFFINTPLHEKMEVDPSYRASRSCLKRSLYSQRTSYPVGKLIQISLDGEETFSLNVLNKKTGQTETVNSPNFKISEQIYADTLLSAIEKYNEMNETSIEDIANECGVKKYQLEDPNYLPYEEGLDVELFLENEND